MDKATVIELAREAGASDITSHRWTSWVGTQSTDFLERFAALVAAHERAECAKVCDEVDRRWINQADKCAAAIRSRT